MDDFAKYWTEKFNALPFEIRHIACMSAIHDQINGLLREKDRLKRRHEQSLREINAHIANLEAELRREMVKEQTKAKGVRIDEEY